MKKKWIIVLIVLCVFAGALQAQKKVITGKVTSAVDGSALPGVNVREKSTSMAVVTDRSGVYSIAVPGHAGTLVFSYLGFITQEVKLGTLYLIN